MDENNNRCIGYAHSGQMNLLGSQSQCFICEKDIKVAQNLGESISIIRSMIFINEIRQHGEKARNNECK